MKRVFAVVAAGGFLALGAAFSSTGRAGEAFVDLFDGKSLAGWVNVNTNPDTWAARGGEIVCSGHPIGSHDAGTSEDGVRS